MNNEVIDHPDYYRLPDGRDLEDFIFERNLSFPVGSALKYKWRAGKKHGESADKDLAKAAHYVKFLAERWSVDYGVVERMVDALVREAAGGRG